MILSEAMTHSDKKVKSTLLDLEQVSGQLHPWLLLGGFEWEHRESWENRIALLGSCDSDPEGCSFDHASAQRRNWRDGLDLLGSRVVAGCIGDRWGSRVVEGCIGDRWGSQVVADCIEDH